MKIFKLRLYIPILLLTILFSYAGYAQKQLRLNAYSAYACDDNHVGSMYYYDNSYYEGSINGGLMYGGGLEMMVAPSKGIEIKYLRHDTQASMNLYSSISTRPNEYDVAINYILLGGSNYFKVNEKVEPFAGGGIGMAIISVQNPTPEISDPTQEKFAWNIKLGTNIWVNPKVGLKLQAEMVSPVQSFGGGFYVGTGGAGAGISGGSTFYQFTFGGGLVFNVGK